MADFDNTNRWTLNKNKEKRDDKDKDYNGSVNIDGKEYWLNGWIKQGKNGAFISGTVKPKDQPQAAKRDPISSGRLPAKQSIMPDDDMGGDDIPF